MSWISIVALLNIAGIIVLIPPVQGQDGPPEYVAIIKNCSESLKADAKNSKPNCFRKCFYEGTGLLTPEGKVKRDDLPPHLKASNIPAEFVERFKTLWAECVDKSETASNEKGLAQCEMIELHRNCVEDSFSKQKWEEKKKDS